MERILADLELDLREIRYLTNDLSNKADETLIPVTKRRIEEMQSHLESLLLEINNLAQKEEVPTEKAIPPVIGKKNEEQEDIPVVFETQSMVVVTETQIDSVEETDNAVVIEEEIVVTLAQQIKPNKNLRESFTLNDTFRFSRELFNGDVDFMNSVLKEIASLETIEEVSSCLQEKLNLNNPEENETLNDLLELVRKYFA